MGSKVQAVGSQRVLDLTGLTLGTLKGTGGTTIIGPDGAVVNSLGAGTGITLSAATGVATITGHARQHAINSSSDHTGFGDAVTKNVGTTSGTVAGGDHDHTGVYLPTAGDGSALIFSGQTAGTNQTLVVQTNGTLTHMDTTGAGAGVSSVNGSTGAVTGVLVTNGDGSGLTNVNAETLDTLDSTYFSASTHGHAQLHDRQHAIDSSSDHTGFGDAVTKNVGSTEGTVAAGDHTHGAGGGNISGAGTAGQIPYFTAGTGISGSATFQRFPETGQIIIVADGATSMSTEGACVLALFGSGGFSESSGNLYLGVDGSHGNGYVGLRVGIGVTVAAGFQYNWGYGAWYTNQNLYVTGGSSLGAAASSHMSFYGATGSAQAAAIANFGDTWNADEAAKANALLAFLRARGDIAT